MTALKVVARDRAEETSAFDLWNDVEWQRYGQVRSIALAGEHFSGRLESGQLGLLYVCRITAAGHVVEHAAEAVPALSAPYYKVVLQLRGVCSFKQGRATAELSPGDFIVYDPRASYSLVNPHAVEQIVVSVPAEHLSLAGRPPTDWLARRLSAQVGGGRLAVTLLCSALDELPRCGAHAQGHVATAICQLLADAVREQLGVSKRESPKLVMRARVLDFVENHLGDPTLSVELVADRLNCSKRYLYDVFDDNDLPLGRYIWKRRLERCKDELVDCDRDRRSLTDISLSWGFNSLAHFSKAFKQEFGAPPGAFRARR